MATNAVSTYLKYVNLQLATEALLDQHNDLSDAVNFKQALVSGNSHTSKFTELSADRFIADGWVVVEHEPNTSTGFSGTLVRYGGVTDPARGLVNGELVLGFRSTAFIDDTARDNEATNVMGIELFGRAFGGIANIEKSVHPLYASGNISDWLTPGGGV